MTIEITQIISALSLLIAAVALFRNLKGDTKADTSQVATMIAKLEMISDDIKEIKNDLKDVKMDIDNLKEKVVLLEASSKQAHKRIDYLQELVIKYEKEKTSSGTR